MNHFTFCACPSKTHSLLRSGPWPTSYLPGSTASRNFSNLGTSTSAWAWGHLGATVSRIGAITYHYESIYILKWFSPLKRAGSFMLTHRYLLLERWKETILKLIQNNCKAYLAILYKHCTSIRRCLYSKECSLSLLSWPYRLEILRLKRKRADWQKYHFWINM